MPKDVGMRLWQARTGLKLSQEELSKLSGVSRVTISKLECGRLDSMSTKTLCSLAKALNVPASYLLCS